jgi:undecaprenyl-diphosphatase
MTTFWGLAGMAGRIKNMVYNRDKVLFHLINQKAKCKALDKSMPLVTRLGNASVTIVVCLAISLLGNTSMKEAGIEALFALATSHLMVQVLKRLVHRERPIEVMADINVFNVPIDFYSFPSGHTTAIFAVTTVFMLYRHVLAVPLMILGVAVGLSRMYVGVHYPTDVFIGMFIGILFAFIAHFWVGGFALYNLLINI